VKYPALFPRDAIARGHFVSRVIGEASWGASVPRADGAHGSVPPAVQTFLRKKAPNSLKEGFKCYLFLRLCFFVREFSSKKPLGYALYSFGICTRGKLEALERPQNAGKLRKIARSTEE
jgi:hypothetical protein